ncbi:MAG: PHP domain-containing protein [Candidatus Marinimicrobia bacterium]|nr:PHP domain-containing protein [Candidatus Neomarinimicrobiota bacterium]
MKNSQISVRIKRLASMMSLLDENPFKIRSFENAARIVRDHEEDMGVLVDEDRLKDVPGIGKSLAYVIMYYAKAGTVGLEQELESQLPVGLPALLDLPGLGMKKVQLLWHKHDISSVELLKQACEANVLAGIKGFGPKLQVKLQEAIAFNEKHISDFYLDTALGVAENWIETLKQLNSVTRIELSGELRRGTELIQSVEFLVDADIAELNTELNAKFNLQLSESNPTILKDPTGLPVELIICNSNTFAAKQLLRTGGDSYMRHLSDRFGSPGDAAINQLVCEKGKLFTTENTLCESLGLQWIEPELRDSYSHFPENIELISTGDIKGVFHAHSTWSDGRNTLEELAGAARNLGYQYLGISEHSQAAYYANGLKPDRVKAQWAFIDQLNDSSPDFHIFKGIEADILSDGRLDYDEDLLAGFDFVVASIHSHFHLDPVKQTDRIVRALQSPFTTILGHPTGRMLMARSGYNPDLTTIIDVAAENDKLIEINTTPKRLDLDWRYLKYAREKGVKISIDPDAHSIKQLQTIPLGVRMARKGGLSAANVLNTLTATEMKHYLQSRSHS